MAHRNIRNGVQTTNKNVSTLRDKGQDIAKTEQRYSESVETINVSNFKIENQVDVNFNLESKIKDTTTQMLIKNRVQYLRKNIDKSSPILSKSKINFHLEN